MRKRARTDLCGGRSVMVVPTATSSAHCPGTVYRSRHAARRSGTTAVGEILGLIRLS